MTTKTQARRAAATMYVQDESTNVLHLGYLDGTAAETAAATA